jgi:hypothetical protein
MNNVSKKFTNSRVWLQVVTGLMWPAGRQLNHAVVSHSASSYFCIITFFFGLPDI